MAMVNANPRTPSFIGIIIGAVLLIVGVWLLIQQWETLKPLLIIFAGLFLTLFGLGILTASAFARRY